MLVVRPFLISAPLAVSLLGTHLIKIQSSESRVRLLIIGFVGHVIGLGDRHGSNILVDQLTWGALHIDFGDVSHLSTPIF